MNQALGFSTHPLRCLTIAVAMLALLPGTTHAQFAATQGPGDSWVLWCFVPWLLIFAVLALSRWLPELERRRLRRAAKRALILYLVLELALLIAVIGLRLAFGPGQGALIAIGTFFLMGLFFCGLVILTLFLLFYGGEHIWKLGLLNRAERQGKT